METYTIPAGWPDQIAVICRKAGDAILEVYERETIAVSEKADDSPLTAADLASHRALVEGLEALETRLPILSEEGEAGLPDWSTRSRWPTYWLIDPLDGTKEFIGRNGEFTVNIALVHQHEPIFGAVYVPVTETLYLGNPGATPNATKTVANRREEIRARPISEDRTLVVVASRRHGSEAVEECLEKLRSRFGTVDLTSMGSSLKLCLVAEGAADFYPRLAPTSEWDTAAAQAIVAAAGGGVTDLAFDPLRYNTKAEILNPHFYVFGDPAYDWRKVLTD